MTVGEKIRTIRQEKGLTQKELGTRIGNLSQQQIGQWETGKANPKKETLQKIANALDVSITELMDIDSVSGNNASIIFENTPKIPGDIIIDINWENFEQYKRIFLLAYEKIIEEIIEKSDFELRYYNADTGEEVIPTEEQMRLMNPRNLSEKGIFLIFQKLVKAIRFNTILNTFTIIFL